jgi:hypothetical protein
MWKIPSQASAEIQTKSVDLVQPPEEFRKKRVKHMEAFEKGMNYYYAPLTSPQTKAPQNEKLEDAWVDREPMANEESKGFSLIIVIAFDMIGSAGTAGRGCANES